MQTEIYYSDNEVFQTEEDKFLSWSKKGLRD
jgi:hypothetical protein